MPNPRADEGDDGESTSVETLVEANSCDDDTWDVFAPGASGKDNYLTNNITLQGNDGGCGPSRC